jgi:mono/diheme cytochrome c family protein
LIRFVLTGLCGGLLSSCGSPGSPTGSTAEAEQHWQLLGEYCFDCHNSSEYTADLALDAMSPDTVADHPDVWEKVVRKLRGRMMPPPGGDRPDNQRVDGLVAWLEGTLDRAFPDPAPGLIVLHRLNRTEYANAIDDLLALDVDPETLLPVDGAEEGFDNVANALTVSPSFIDQYLTAARTLSARAVGNPSPRPVGVPYTFSSVGQQFHVEGLPLGTRGGALIEHYFPSDGEYLLNIGDLVTGLWGFNQEHVNTVIATLDGKRFFELDIGGADDLKALDQIGAPAVDEINARLKNIPFTATAGLRRLGVTFLHRSFAESDRHLYLHVPGTGQDAVMTLNSVEIYGPVKATGLSNTPSRDKIFSCYPEQGTDARSCALHIVTDLAGEAFRGASTDDDISRLMRLYETGLEFGGFEEGIKYALSGILAHPKFLYRLEPAAEDSMPGAGITLTSLELASRLSFFLWSSIPDAELLEVAASDRLKDPEVLERQVRRMLADPRSETLASNFAYQWLGLGELEAIDPDPALFVDVHRSIREFFVTEARLFIDSVFREDRSVLDLLTANHTYLNQSLALHYGINDVRGERFRRVELADRNRWGLFGKGGVLMVSSYPNRTSPVLRGAWLLESILGTPPAAPPPDVEALPENVAGEVPAGVRERLEVHRANTSCNACHGAIDPLGFALENFDAVGRWREKDREAGTLIDASGVLADGRHVEGPIALREAILERPDQFVQTLIEKLMTYGLGRKVEYSDMPTVRRIVRHSAAQDYRFSAIILGIVNSPQFQMKGVPPADGAG